MKAGLTGRPVNRRGTSHRYRCRGCRRLG